MQAQHYDRAFPPPPGCWLVKDTAPISFLKLNRLLGSSDVTENASKGRSLPVLMQGSADVRVRPGPRPGLASSPQASSRTARKDRFHSPGLREPLQQVRPLKSISFLVTTAPPALLLPKPAASLLLHGEPKAPLSRAGS